jgi:hypothetical protein
MTFFWTLWAFDLIIALVAVYFFFMGLLDGSVSSFNLRIWALLLLGLALVIFGSLWLKSKEQMLVAKLLLGILAIPGMLYVLFFLFVLIGKPRWN